MLKNIILGGLLIPCFLSCSQTPKKKSELTQSEKMTENHTYTNSLITETSPYLLQHAHNPVNWRAWNNETLELAQKNDKLLLISIGYSACHWCHVMEHESFEDEEVAALMNEKFICIKVDREERPDIDQVYMSAIQLQKQRGGWPLNFFALPDGKPFTGGTYFPKEQWISVLKKVENDYRNNREQVIKYCESLTRGVQQSEYISLNTTTPKFTEETLSKTVAEWQKSFDDEEGGPNHAPKFPLPNNYLFLLRYAMMTNDIKVFDHVTLTLTKMAYGGIYDHLGGGFARYSTDTYWKAPHFEKMLYDNAQLVSLYSEAYQATGNTLYKTIVRETLEFVKRELTDETGAFYSALDADSEGEEGKYYVWTEDELKTHLKDDFELIKDYYNVNSKGLWENGNYILLRKENEDVIAKKHNLSRDDFNRRLNSIKSKLLDRREKTHTRPGRDDKSLTSWNALMLKGYVDAYQVFDDKDYLVSALKNATFILTKQKREDGGLVHNYKNGRSTINGYLEDYCFTIEAFIALYEATFDEKWLFEARTLSDYTITHFYNKENGMFFFTSDLDSSLIARKMEVNDNVIPASNSSMAKALFILGHYFDNENYLKLSETMLNNVHQFVISYGSGYSNWCMLLLNRVRPFYEVVISGSDAHKKRKELAKYYFPNKLIVGSETDSSLPLLEFKFNNDETTIYVCQNKTCQLPVSEIEEAIKQMR